MAGVSAAGDAVCGQGSRALVVTPCSSRKRHPPGPRTALLNRASQCEVQAEWLALVANASPVERAIALYRGRAFGFAVEAASSIGGDVGIVSAGLGYVQGDKEIPSYDLTLRARIEGSVRDRIVGGFEPVTWWRSVQEGRFASSLVEDASGRPLVLVCLSRDYASMVSDELSKLAAGGGNMRIFGLNISSALPKDVAEFVLPYDERLTSVGVKGTRVDFPQRALLHYVSTIHRSSDDFAEDAERVRRSLAGVAPRPKRVQRRESDDAIKSRIRSLLPQIGASQAKILQHLRHVENVSCEQGRFSKLFAIVQDEVGGRH